MSYSGSDEQHLNRILDWIGVASLLILLVHVYYYCQQSFVEWQLTGGLTDQVLAGLERAGKWRS